MRISNGSNGRTKARLDTLQSIELAEGVEIQLRIAGPYVRVLAYLLDLLIRAGICIAAYLLLMFIGMIIGFTVAQGLSMLLMFFLTFFYYIVFEAGKRGASPGKRAMGLRVVDTSGAPISWGQAFIRNMLRFADGMPFFSYGFGLLTTLLTKRFQRLGDLLANTVVVYDRQPKLHLSSLPPAMTSVAPSAPLTREEQAAILGFKERGGMWSEARRVELANHASALTGASGEKGMTKLLGVAQWLGDKH
ncbi:RDD family protein [Verrucomicrobiaceae bacterium 5K15]|uniref:RDD family protein n=1 Tax=Oceaniferula flava TaxID=2800421 RepID=A0AAE2SDJ8_9BACT|nr:RDD family protein [Oceaniferula flavus]MBK1855938.1 RDD family protein [Oceaniferula flavus]MBM1137245.1 RDD family protein [Oceaniferula flavus]